MGGAVIALAWQSLMNRKGSALLTILAVALSVGLFLGVEKARQGAPQRVSSAAPSPSGSSGSARRGR
ncbi:MAG: hypothetical protein AAFY10_14490, partial [Pseudomonadota bacterium]